MLAGSALAAAGTFAARGLRASKGCCGAGQVLHGRRISALWVGRSRHGEVPPLRKSEWRRLVLLPRMWVGVAWCERVAHRAGLQQHFW
eukprot:438870-Alexandrium_andersonii.AAC.1